MQEGILQGIRVLDLTRIVAGPYATQILADFGAEVIKVQTAKTATGAEDNASGYFAAWNRNKKSITLNMSHDKARELFRRLASKSDVVVENFTPRVMANWGLHYESLQSCKSDLIMLSISGMGQTGPWKNYGAYGPTLQSLGGLTYLTSFSAAEPLGLGYSYVDPVIGLYGAITVLAALEHREKTGAGRHIDLSGYEAACSLIGPTLLEASANEADVRPSGNGAGAGEEAPYGCYRCRGTDSWCVIAVANEDQWQALCRVAHHEEWSTDSRFTSATERKEYREALDVLVEDWTRRQDADEVVAILQKAGVPAGIVQTAEDLARDRQLSARNFFITLKHPLWGDIVADSYPFRFHDQETENWQAAPLLGADNDYVFGELLGLTPDEITLFTEKGIIS